MLTSALKPSKKSVDPKGSFAHRSEHIAWRGGKAHKAFVGSAAMGSLQVFPVGFGEAPGSARGRASECCVTHEDTVFARITLLADTVFARISFLAGSGGSCPTQATL